jgi:AmmeMemoRadiSam system protein B
MVGPSPDLGLKKLRTEVFVARREDSTFSGGSGDAPYTWPHMTPDQPGDLPPFQPLGVPQEPARPKFDPSATHQQKPRLRPVRGFPAQVGNQVMLGLADARQISDKMVLAPMAIQGILPLLNGERTLMAIVGEVGQGLTEQNLQGLVAQLDEAGLLFGPRFDQMLAQMRQEFDSTVTLPPAATAAFTDSLVSQSLGREATDDEKLQHGPDALRQAMDQWIQQTLDKEPNPAFDALPVAVIAPHIDYPRGWLNYAAVWGRMRSVDRPDRVIILGTNHFGSGTGVTACDKGFSSPLGECPVDQQFVGALRQRLGASSSEMLFANRYDHEREHSIELQLPWIQHCLGGAEPMPIFGVLVHDPSVNNGESYDGQGLGLRPFVEAMRGAIGDVGGKTLIVSSADLSHVGPMFGDRQTLAGDSPEAQEARNRVLSHDQEMLAHIANIRPDDLVTAMAWQQNPTRWCSTGNLVAALMIAQPQRVRLLRYMAALDPQGSGMVTSAGAVME